MDTNNQPFWKDGTSVAVLFPSRCQSSPVFSYFSIAIRAIALIIILVVAYKSPIAVGIALIALGLPLVFRIYILYWLKNTKQTGDEIQQLAQQRLGASHIGSALHVAGHPLLQRDQPVVLALAGDQLSIHSYESPVPLDAIPLRNIQTVQTVSYDDERVPYVDVIDSAAQAIQLTFLWRDQTCTCLFRSMKKMRPIDWYQALQQARSQTAPIK
jgi:hypothetical protein